MQDLNLMKYKRWRVWSKVEGLRVFLTFLTKKKIKKIYIIYRKGSLKMPETLHLTQNPPPGRNL